VANVTLDGLGPVALWSTIELGIGLTAGSAAALRPLLRLISGGSLQSPSTSKNNVKHRSNAIDTFATDTFVTDTFATDTFATDTFATDTGNDVSLQVMVKGGKVPSVGDAESQKAIIGEAAISIRSDVNVVEEFVGGDIV
jgi:hypothetical protein